MPEKIGHCSTAQDVGLYADEESRTFASVWYLIRRHRMLVVPSAAPASYRMFRHDLSCFNAALIELRCLQHVTASVESGCSKLT